MAELAKGARKVVLNGTAVGKTTMLIAQGLNAAGYFLASTKIVHPSKSQGSLTADWSAVGNDVRRATAKYAAKRYG